MLKHWGGGRSGGEKIENIVKWRMTSRLANSILWKDPRTLKPLHYFCYSVIEDILIFYIHYNFSPYKKFAICIFLTLSTTRDTKLKGV